MKSTVAAVSPAARDLQDKLHELLSRLAATMEHVKNWPEATDTAVHVESSTRLIHSIRGIVASLEKVEQQARSSSTATEASLQEQLQSCPIPVDLLELLDCGLNPDCFVRGLLREAMGQLSGLNRRKQALEMLCAAVQEGCLDQEQLVQPARGSDLSPTTTVVKRERNNDDALETECDGREPPAKKPKMDPEAATS